MYAAGMVQCAGRSSLVFSYDWRAIPSADFVKLARDPCCCFHVVCEPSALLLLRFERHPAIHFDIARFDQIYGPRPKGSWRRGALKVNSHLRITQPLPFLGFRVFLVVAWIFFCCGL